MLPAENKPEKGGRWPARWLHLSCYGCGQRDGTVSKGERGKDDPREGETDLPRNKGAVAISIESLL